MDTGISNLIKIYDENIPFGEYAKRVLMQKHSIPDNPEDGFKICCPLHDESTPSFSFVGGDGVWTCFGSCNATGKTFEFHKRYRMKIEGLDEVNLMSLLRDLYSIFPDLVPPPKINPKTNEFNRILENINNATELLSWEQKSFSQKPQIQIQKELENMEFLKAKFPDLAKFSDIIKTVRIPEYQDNTIESFSLKQAPQSLSEQILEMFISGSKEAYKEEGDK